MRSVLGSEWSVARAARAADNANDSRTAARSRPVGSDPKQEEGHAKTEGARRQASFTVDQSRSTSLRQQLEERSQPSTHDIALSQLSTPIAETDNTWLDQLIYETEESIADIVIDGIDWEDWNNERRRKKK